MRKSFWLNPSQYGDENKWVEISESEFHSAVSIAGFDKGFFSGVSTAYFEISHSFELPNPSNPKKKILFRRGKIKYD